MKKLFRYTLVVVALALVGAQFIRPAKTNPVADPARSIHAQMSVPADVRAVLERSCRDCHSNDTRWPWYSNVAPVSWFVIDHVNHGRSHINFSDWARFSPSDADQALEEICEMVREGEMPLRSYLLMHRSARLSPADVDTLCRWSDVARAQLRSAESGGK